MGRKKDSVQSENVGEIFEEETHLHQAPENQTPIYPYDHSSQSVRNESKRDELDSDVIYSGRDIAQMNQPVTQGYEPDDLTSKKKKMSDIFKWKK